MKNYYSKVALLLLSFIGIFNSASAQQTCFTISDSENKIYKFRLSDGKILDSKSLSSLSSPEASTLNIAGDTLWILNADELHFVKTNNGSLANTKVSGSNISAQPLTGALGTRYISDFDAMSVDVNGNIWAGTSSNNPCLLVVIDPSTGNVKEDFFGAGVDYLQVDNSSYSQLRFDAMAFDPVTNELYANLNGTSQNYDYLFKINTSNGGMELIRQFNTISDIEGMAFDAIGDLYVTTGANASNGSNDDKLWRVDLENGDVTMSVSLWGGDMETCDCVFGNPISAIEISGYVFFDEDKDTAFDNSEIGKSNYLVSLYKDVNNNGVYDNGTDQFVDSMRTYSNGFYRFRESYTSGTVNYVIVTDTNDLPDNNYYTTDNIETASFSAGRQVDENNNFGFVVDSTQFVNVITGTVFADVNEDGIRNGAENGVSGVKVYLYEDENCDGQISYGEELLDSTTVGTDGKYSFIQNWNPTGTGGTTYTTQTIEKQVSSSSDDAEERGSGSVTTTSSDLDFGEYMVGLRFRNINLPKNAVVTEAYIQLTGTETESSYTNFRIYGEDTDDASTFNTNDDNISSRNKTSNFASWTPGNWVNNGKYNSPSLVDVVKEISSRSNWSSGNDMAFICTINTGDRDAYTYNANSSKAPKLFITYVTDSSSTSNDSTVCYATTIDELTVPSGASMTTDNIEVATFTSGGNTDSLNDFGLWGGALPVDWLSFEGFFVGDLVELEWSTAAEENNSHFVIERTYDGAHWEILGEVNGNGTTSNISKYSFTDDNPYDVNYYRIKQVDFDGAYEYSEVIMVHRNIAREDFNIRMFPNPASESVQVNWDRKVGNVEVNVVDVRGSVVYSISNNGEGQIKLDLTNIDTGIYFIQLKNAQATSTKRLVVRR